MEGAYFLATGNAKNFSEQQILDCNAGMKTLMFWHKQYIGEAITFLKLITFETHTLACEYFISTSRQV